MHVWYSKVKNKQINSLQGYQGTDNPDGFIKDVVASRGS